MNGESKWKQLDSRVIFTHPRITLVEDRVELPDGHQTDYLRVVGASRAATVICRQENQFLLQKEYSYPPNQVLLQFPGGSVDEEEVLTDGINRELMEESGYRAKNLREIGKYLLNNRRSDAYMHVFVGKDLVKASLQEDWEEEIENVWLTATEIDEKITAGEIINVHVIAAWQLYKLRPHP